MLMSIYFWPIAGMIGFDLKADRHPRVPLADIIG